MLKQPLGVLGETAKAGELLVSADGLGVMAEGRVVSRGGRSGSAGCARKPGRAFANVQNLYDLLGLQRLRPFERSVAVREVCMMYSGAS